MPKILGALLLVLATSMAFADDGIITRDSPYSFSQTLERIEAALAARGVTVFARVDHSAEARKIGLEMPPTTVLIFGNPKAGTPLMISAPSLAIDLPLKLLIRQDSGGKVSVSFNSALFLGARHKLSGEQLKPLDAPAALLDAALR